MKWSNMLLLFMGLSAVFTSCSPDIKSELIELSPVKFPESQHIGQGVWLIIPSGYGRAESYEGFQANDKSSSISVKIDRHSISEMKKIFDEKKLKRSHVELLELHPVNFGDLQDAFFSVVKDKRKKTIRYLLCVNVNGLTYNIKAFCFAGNYERDDPKLRKALFSSYIGDRIEKKALFEIANFNVNEEKDISMVYTKDGVYPTKSPDSSYIEVKQLESPNSEFDWRVVQEALFSLTGVKTMNIKPYLVGRGVILEGKVIGEKHKAYVALISPDPSKKERTLVKCWGNSESDLSEFKKFVSNNFIKTVIVGH